MYIPQSYRIHSYTITYIRYVYITHSLSKNLSILFSQEWNGDDTFQCYQQPTEKTILNGELFKEKERVFLKKTLRPWQVKFFLFFPKG